MPERVYVDRIEEDRVVLVGGPEGRETASLPLNWLPKEVREGAALDLSFAPAPDDRTHEEVQDLLDELFGASGT